MDLVIAPFAEHDFLVRALVAGLLAVVATSLVGTWIVLRGMAFIGDALAHGVVPGITVAFLVGWPLWLGAALGAAAMIAGIDLIDRRTRLGQDTSIGLLFVGMLALGVILISLRGAYAGDLTAILFGDAIAVGAADIVLTAAAAAVALVATIALYRPLLVLTFSPDKADGLGLRPRATHLALLVLVAVTIVASFQTVGTLLVFAFLIAPPAAAGLVARRVPVLMALAIVFGSIAVVVGLLLSFHVGTAASPTVAGVTVAEFFLVLAGRDLRSRWRGRGRSAVAAA